MKLASLLHPGLLLAGLLLATPAFAAQNTGPLATEASNAAFSLEVRNGNIIENGKPAGRATVGSLVDYIGKQYSNFSVVLGPGVADVAINDVVLHLKDFQNYVVGVAIVKSASEPLTIHSDPNTYLVSLERNDPPRQLAVFNLSTYLNAPASPDEANKSGPDRVNDRLKSLEAIIMSTIQDLGSDKSAPKVGFQFHGGANLLVVTGNSLALDVSDKVIRALLHQDAAPAHYSMGLDWANGRAQPILKTTQSLTSTDPFSSQNTVKQEYDSTVKQLIDARNALRGIKTTDGSSDETPSKP